mgnify:FL=1
MKAGYEFSITTFCQAKCYSCQRIGDDGETRADLKQEHMPVETFKRILSGIDFNKNKTPYIKLCGEVGDPMMHPQIEDFVSLILDDYKKHYIAVLISTNGALRNPDWYTRMGLRYKDDLAIVFGIDGTDRETNWMYREGVNWQRAMDNMTTYFNSGGSGEWHFIVFEWNWHQIPIAKKMADKIDCGVFFKFNAREFGKISDENKKQAYKLIEELDGEIVP